MNELFVLVGVIVFLEWIVPYLVDDVTEKFDDP